MAELAAGAVSSLLSVIRNEALLLGGVQDDVQFIKEEMESMNSFLLHLARTAPPRGEHDEQVRTWMNQVRVLAQDCNNCIDLYLYRGNPDVQRTRGKIRRYLWWAYWFLHKLVAQHRAAIQLGQLKERARHVGERRLRYGVEVPAKRPPHAAGQMGAATPSSSAARGYAAGDDEEDGEDQLMPTTTNHYGKRAFFEPRSLDEYVMKKLLEWRDAFLPNSIETMSTVIMAPDTDPDALNLARENLVFSPERYLSRGYHRGVLVDIPAVHLNVIPLRPKEVLYYILRELNLENSRSQSQEQGINQGEREEKGLDSWEVHRRKLDIYFQKKEALLKIKENIKKMHIYKKLDKLKSDIQIRPVKSLEKTKCMDQLDLQEILRLLFQSSSAVSPQDQVKNKGIYKLPEWDSNIISKIVKKLKKYIEEDGKSKKFKERGEEEEEEEAGGGEHGGDRGEEDEEEEARGGGEREGDGGEEDEDEEEGGGGEREGDGGAAVGGEGEEGHCDDGTDEDDDDDDTAPILLHEAQYAHILRDLFLKTSVNKPLQAQQEDRPTTKEATKTTLDEDQIKQMIHEAKQEILWERQEGKYDKNQEIGEHSAPDENTKVVSKEIEQKMDKIKQEFKEQLKIKGLVDLIRNHLKGAPLFILKVDETINVSRWEDIRNALSLLECSADALIVTNTKDVQQAKEYCYPPLEPIDYSLVGLYYDTVLELTSHQRNEDNCKPHIFRGILEECEPYEFCMKIFTHALYANPKRSNEELNKLHMNLQASPKSPDIIAKKMFKFSYSDMSKEYKSCLMYLAIFPQGHKIRRSTLIGRWVAEGLIFKEDWPSSVRQANQCFDELINRWLAYPADIGATGKVKSCVVGDLVHRFITNIARKQHIVETRLSSHLARHFSIFNDLQLRSSDKIENFFQRLSKSSRISLLKVLDLEGCQCFHGKNQRYLKDICRKMLLLRYLCLRRTNIKELPSEINNLRELEVLDIRQTDVPEYATRHLLLLKLKRLLVGHIDPSPHSCEIGTATRADSVQIPRKIGKMVNLEVLSNVEPKHDHDLRDIGKLWQLRKLGVIINDSNEHLGSLLQAIKDLHEGLRSLSIVARHEGTPTSRELPADIVSRLRHHPKFLESLNISGSTFTGHLLALFAKDVNNNVLGKVTISTASMSHDYLNVLAKLPRLRCLRLQYMEFTESVLTFEVEEFESLKYLLVERSNLTEIIFKDGAVPELEKMILSFTNIASIIGVHHLKKLEELVLNNNNNDRLLSSFADAKHIVELTLCGTLLKQDDLQILTKKLKMRCLALLDMSVSGVDGLTSQITFNKDDFLKLNQLTVHCSTITDVVFTAGSAPKLEKIVGSVTSLSGIHNLLRLKELEFHSDFVPDEMREAIKEHKNRPHLKHAKPENQDQAIEDGEGAAVRFTFCCKNQV